MTWNLFHGRDAPPDPALFTRRSRLARVTERNVTHVQVNRLLRREFAGWLAAAEWDVALLQEAPPAWLGALSEATGASGELALTSRNSPFPRLRRLLADLNTDLVGSDEGGSNQLLVRPPWTIAETRTLVLCELPERRMMLWARLHGPGRGPLCVGNVHLSTSPHAAIAEADLAAREAVAWAEGDPLVLGGDFNFRQARKPGAYERLEAEYGLTAPTAPDSIDHLLVRGVDLEEPPRALPAEDRELIAERGLRLRLSDHAPVVARIAER